MTAVLWWRRRVVAVCRFTVSSRAGLSPLKARSQRSVPSPITPLVALQNKTIIVSSIILAFSLSQSKIDTIVLLEPSSKKEIR